jgi:hypothetical protein
MFFPSISLLVRMLLENKSDLRYIHYFKKLEWLNPSQIKSDMASFLTKPKTKSETSSSNLQVQFKEIPNEDVGQDETL